MYYDLNFYICCFLIIISNVHCRNHDIKIKNDNRQSILLSHFGYYPNGYLFLSIKLLDLPQESYSRFGFTLDLSSTSSISSYAESTNSKCMLTAKHIEENKLSVIVMKFNQRNRTLSIKNYGSNLDGILFYRNVNLSRESYSTVSSMNINFTMNENLRQKFKRHLIKLYGNFIDTENATEVVDTIVKQFDNGLLISAIEQNALLNVINLQSFGNIKQDPNILSDLKMILIMIRNRMINRFSKVMENLLAQLHNSVVIPYGIWPLKLLIKFPTQKEEGDFDFYFHNCVDDNLKTHSKVNISMVLIEKNWNSYLSAGDQPLPLLFFIMCSLFLILAIIWAITLRTSKHMVFKIHYLMLVLLIMKALTLFFHAINYYEVGRYGVQEQGWAIMYYITHLLKGALLFTTIILIGAGWAFIKHMLSGKEKKIFIIIIPLQILANIAGIIIGESEESAARYLTWRNIFLLVDLICCGAILFPVIWSIKHLKEAANIDGKQMQNLMKLRMFRHFYILIICYIYFTRIIVYLLIITVSFKLSWTVDLFREVSTVVFMVITGYKFRPISNNPYLLVPNEDEEATEQEQLDHAWSQSGITDGVTKVTHSKDILSGSEDDDTVCYEKPVKTDHTKQEQQTTDQHSTTTSYIGNGIVHTSKL